eukprot:TRINITY_DN1360_c0_g1_i2.p1 TRINITY_DN1360_c0_g1~~TRINITY_DN1360_c0_g1_i2.p1  ORF type:complete len:267 (-),score=63.53 TRINITY_DN1360_c0_g1_i2:22-822(-)
MWWNFNSLLDEPQYLSQFYLSAFLDTLLGKGYSIFVVRGSLPPCRHHSYGPNWVRVLPPKQAAGGGGSVRSYDDDLNAAIQASLGGGQGGLGSSDAQLEAAIRASMADQQQQPQQQPPVAATVTAGEPMEDDELALAIQMSLGNNSNSTTTTAPALTTTSTTTTTTTQTHTQTQAQPPAEPGPDTNPADITQIALKLPDGSRVTRKFFATDALQGVHSYAQTLLKDQAAKLELVSTFPPKRFGATDTTTLREAGLVPSAMLLVELL